MPLAGNFPAHFSTHLPLSTPNTTCTQNSLPQIAHERFRMTYHAILTPFNSIRITSRPHATQSHPHDPHVDFQITIDSLPFNTLFSASNMGYLESMRLPAALCTNNKMVARASLGIMGFFFSAINLARWLVSWVRKQPASLML